MPLVNPLTNGASDGVGVFGGSADYGTTARRQPSNGSDNPPVGSGAINSPHNLPMHCAVGIIAALALLFGLHLAGFRFAFDVGMGRS